MNDTFKNMIERLDFKKPKKLIKKLDDPHDYDDVLAWLNRKIAKNLNSVDIHARDSSSTTPLIYVCSLGQQLTNFSLRLIELGSDVHATDRFGLNALFYSVERGASEVTYELIKRGAAYDFENIKSLTQNHTPPVYHHSFAISGESRHGLGIFGYATFFYLKGTRGGDQSEGFEQNINFLVDYLGTSKQKIEAMLLDYQEVHYQEIGQFPKKPGKLPSDKELFLETVHKKMKDLHDIWVEKETLTSITSSTSPVDDHALTNCNAAEHSLNPAPMSKKTHKL